MITAPVMQTAATPKTQMRKSVICRGEGCAPSRARIRLTLKVTEPARNNSGSEVTATAR